MNHCKRSRSSNQNSCYCSKNHKNTKSNNNHKTSMRKSSRLRRSSILADSLEVTRLSRNRPKNHQSNISNNNNSNNSNRVAHNWNILKCLRIVLILAISPFKRWTKQIRITTENLRFFRSYELNENSPNSSKNSCCNRSKNQTMNKAETYFPNKNGNLGNS